MTQVSEKPVEAVIRLSFHSLLTLTTAEFEQLEREVQAQVLVGDVTLGTKILAALLEDQRGRYHEALQTNKRARD